jgi:hypothetical protein
MELHYSYFMNDNKSFCKPGLVRLALAAALLVTLTGCVGYVNGSGGGDYAFAAQDDYVYYPQYECYYSVSRHQYAYRQGNAWVARSAPQGVSVNVLLTSPSVKMNFHDSPANHHATVVKQYPKNWKPSAAKQGNNHKDEEHGQENAR